MPRSRPAALDLVIGTVPFGVLTGLLGIIIKLETRAGALERPANGQAADAVNAVAWL